MFSPWDGYYFCWFDELTLAKGQTLTQLLTYSFTFDSSTPCKQCRVVYGQSIIAPFCCFFLLTPSSCSRVDPFMGCRPSGKICSSLGYPWATVPSKTIHLLWCEVLHRLQYGRLFQHCILHGLQGDLQLLRLLLWSWCLHSFFLIFFPSLWSVCFALSSTCFPWGTTILAEGLSCGLCCVHWSWLCSVWSSPVPLLTEAIIAACSLPAPWHLPQHSWIRQYDSTLLQIKIC